ncbi:Ldh family oxidoreductase [Liquorilactobacillus satsumensis]|uniref:Putative malate dehydrogenase (Putative) n=1 Tax=Liquorilactobacillus satsumensis DSM 16230 = JCM 12392 TaxID=1423801 RepID=A0A0R1UZN4_9LACO|nr:Ldh family oxidoreductase [Liquorilactobacillus satsumensis]KRL98877.1 putative malate dehydrogenase (putative) [Liquorilactobacillus satsumensis DSM 16230 = JCM 12392]MCC7666279.1 malate dehydrogenase [Liquorilactobacillus satsumensis]MCP9312794.1 Ldh family oxidoreductase [Liquorilactobacillus satsumensis]MCP9327940.1 Ldh family oxidoreductase [Liquorilactobacillus satsumensis]MCP9358044.1 Ldh family oxidoreductase [Liquorilactobacillus satsumensis]
MVKRYNSEKIKQLVFKIYQAYGFSNEDSEKVAATLLYTDLHGIESHGVQRLAMYDHFIQNGKIRVQSKPEIIKETDVSAVVDAHFGLGQLNGIYSMEVAIQKAKEHGVGIVTTKNSGHYGIAGFYANLAATAGLIGMSSTNSRPAMVPTHAMKAFIGTNPIGFAMPAKPHPFIFDAATSTVPQGKIEVYRKLEKDLPAFWVAKNGTEPVTSHTDKKDLDLLRDPDANVALTPLGGVAEETGSHKGFGLGIIVEIFTSILSLGNISTEISPENLEVGPCQSFVAIDPAIFGDKEQIIERFSAYLQDIRHLPAVPGKTIYVHGDKEALAYENAKKYGIEIDDRTLEEITAIAKRLHVSTSEYLN